MSQNLIEMLRAREGAGHPTALAALKEAMERDGEITDDARRHAAAVSGLPEATVYGISTFYDDLVEQRGRRHVAVCTGTACWAAHPGDHAAELGERLGVPLGERSEDGSVSYGTTVCLGFCHSSPAYRDGTVVDAGPGALERVASGAAERAPEPDGRTMLDEPVLLGARAAPSPGCGGRWPSCRPSSCWRRSPRRTCVAAAEPASRPGRSGRSRATPPATRS